MTGLFTALKTDSLNFRNRVAFPPMASEKSTEDGFPTEKLYDHYKKRSKYPGLVIVEHSYVDPRGRLSENQLGIYSDEHIEKLERLADIIESNGAVSAIQINHAGGQCKEELIGEKPVAPSDAYFEDVDTLTRDQMEEIKNNFVEAAKRAEGAGFDAVEVHGAHGFLLGQFMSPHSNQREDEFGGDDLENRMRFPLEVVEAVKDVITDTSLLYRLGATDRDDEGQTVDESKVFAEELEKRGIEMIDVSGNLCGSRPEELEGKQGYFVPLAEDIKEAVDVPVIGVGGVKDGRYADKVIREGKVDMIAVGREQWQDPEWVSKAKMELKEDE